MTFVDSGVCGVAPPPGYEWVNSAVKVDFYSADWAGGIHLGTVAYCHLTNPCYPRLYHGNELPISLGNVGLSVDLGEGSCYRGSHVHLVRSSSSASTILQTCWATVGTGNVLYRFTY